MNPSDEFAEIIESIKKKDNRYRRSAFYFIRDALEYTVKTMNPKVPIKPEGQHVTADALLDGIRAFALEQYGPMTPTVLEYWGIKSTKDFGEVVFLLVDSGVFGKTEDDNREDFFNAFKFHDAFVKPFLPKSKS